MDILVQHGIGGGSTVGKNDLVDAINEVMNGDGTTMDIINDMRLYSTYKLNKDANGIYTEVQHKRVDGTLYYKSVLSGGTSPQYTARTETYYKMDGTTVDFTKSYTRTYDTDGNLVNEVMA